MHRYAVVIATIAAVACLLAGFVFAGQLSSALAVRFEDKELPPEPTTTVLPASELAPIAPVAQVDLPEGSGDDPLLALAVESLQEAVDTREHTGPGLSLVVEVTEDGSDDAAEDDGSTRDESFTASLDGTTLTVEGPRRGAAQALFRLADAAAGGGDWADVADGTTRSPALPHRFVDTGAVGIEPDVTAYLAQDDYAHTSGALENVVLDAEPWIDPQGLERAAADWREFIDHVVSYGYNGVYVAGFLEYVSFDTVGDGFEVYPEDHPERHRQTAMREQVGELWRYADEMGLDVVFKTDMLALSGPLEDYLERELGGIDANDPRLWEVYRAGLDEFFTTFPWADGLMIRIGEAGAIYNSEFWDYYSALAVTDPQGVQTMLRTAADVAAAVEMLRPLAEAAAAIEAGLLGNRSHPPAIAAELLLERLLRAPLAPPEQARLPLNLLARHGLTVAQALDATSAAGAPAVAFRRDYAGGLLELVPEPRQLNRARQIRAALTRRQLQRIAAGHAPEAGTGPMLAFAAWRAARRAAD